MSTTATWPPPVGSAWRTWLGRTFCDVTVAAHRTTRAGLRVVCQVRGRGREVGGRLEYDRPRRADLDVPIIYTAERWAASRPEPIGGGS